MSNRACAPSLVFRTDRLGGIFNHHQAVPLRQMHHRIHVGHLPEQVDRDDALRLLGNPRGDLAYIQVVGRRIDVHEDGSGAEAGNRANGCEERIRRGDHFVARADIFDHQTGEQCIAARRNSDAVGTLRVGSDRPFAVVDFRAQDEVLRLEDFPDRLVDFLFDGGVLRLKIE